MAPVYKIAVIQLYPKASSSRSELVYPNSSQSQPLQIEANYERAAKFIRSAASQGAQLAVLPEYHLTNWLPEDPKFWALSGQWKVYLDKYQALAKECNICIVPGTIVEKHPDAGTEDGKLLNVAYFIDNHGEILGRYQKKNLWHPERPHLTSSTYDAHEVFSTPLGPVGMLICWDLAFPEAFRELIAKGAKIIIVPTFWTLNDCSRAGLKRNPRAEALFLESTVVSRTFENTCAVIFVNAGGPVGRGYAGLSQVAVPFVGSLGKLASGEENMSIVDLDMEILEEAEDNYKVREDLAREDWHYDYRHGKPKANL